MATVWHEATHQLDRTASFGAHVAVIAQERAMPPHTHAPTHELTHAVTVSTCANAQIKISKFNAAYVVCGAETMCLPDIPQTEPKHSKSE